MASAKLRHLVVYVPRDGWAVEDYSALLQLESLHLLGQGATIGITAIPRALTLLAIESEGPPMTLKSLDGLTSGLSLARVELAGVELVSGSLTPLGSLEHLECVNVSGGTVSLSELAWARVNLQGGLVASTLAPVIEHPSLRRVMLNGKPARWVDPDSAEITRHLNEFDALVREHQMGPSKSSQT